MGRADNQLPHTGEVEGVMMKTQAEQESISDLLGKIRKLRDEVTAKTIANEELAKLVEHLAGRVGGRGSNG